MEGEGTEHETDQYTKAIEAQLNDCKTALKGYPGLISRSFKTTCTYSEVGGESEWKQNVIRVLQFNILADALGTEAGSFDKVPVECLKWAFRKYRILEQILLVNPDVICLEEVDHFGDYFQPIFDSLGFDGFFCPKKDSPCLKFEGNSGPDGVAVFYRRSKLSLVEIENNYLENVEEAESNQSIIVCMLRSKMAEKNICFAVTHLKAKKGFENLRAAQAKSCLKFVDQLRKKVNEKSAVIICGDFNGTTSENCYQIMANHCEGSLASAYLKATGDEPSYTTWKIRQDIEKKCTIDYIWFSHKTLDVVSYLQLPDEKEIPETRFPSYSHASDHLALCCDFVFKD